MLIGSLLKAIGWRHRRSAQNLIAEGTSLLGAGAWKEAAACFEAARQSVPRDVILLNNLGLCHANAGNYAAAERCFGEILQIEPANAPALLNLGNVAMSRADPEAACVQYEAALARLPADPGLLNNLGMASRAMARVDSATGYFRSAVNAEPRFGDAHANLLYCMQLLPEYGPADVYAEHCRWAELHERPLLADTPRHGNDRDANRLLRIGYISADFHRHAVAKFFEPVLASHDHGAFRIHLYHSSKANDAVTKRIRACADVWREVADLGDEGLAALVRQDAIDILIDLSGHTRGNRLLCFARRPAPLQLTYLGYENTTGMRSIDYRITDAIADPAGFAERFHREQLLRLPRVQWCFRPDPGALPVGPLPALAAGCVTFGSFNNIWKINRAVIRAWAEVLSRVPASKLVLVGVPGNVTRARFESIFAAEGIDAARLSIYPSVSDADFWKLRRTVDIALDPFPYNGVTSTCEALYVGTPLVGLAGTYGASRAAASLLTAVGLAELVAKNEDEYVEINVRLAADLPALDRLRSSLRERMQGSPLMDSVSLARALEDAYRRIWKDWVARPSPPD
jgi:protein O-GlcNAc transferase